MKSHHATDKTIACLNAFIFISPQIGGVTLTLHKLWYFNTPRERPPFALQKVAYCALKGHVLQGRLPHIGNVRDKACITGAVMLIKG